MNCKPFPNADVKSAFAAFPKRRREDLLRLRELVFLTASQNMKIDGITETLKWGQPSYLPVRPKTGTTIRLGLPKNDPDHFGLYVHCQTSLIAEFRELFGAKLAFEGNRAVLLKHGSVFPADELAHCISLALTYHLDKRC